MDNKKNKKYLIFGAIFIVLLGVSFIVYTITSANSGDNKIKVSYAKITSIETGNGNFTNDGLDYSNENSSSYSSTTGYVAGNDSNNTNRIVRSFDSLTYNFSYLLEDKEEQDDYDDRKVNITVELTEDEAKYISFDKNSLANETSYTYTFDGASTYDNESASITLYILGAPNGTTISPKFTIKESTDEENGIILGKISDSNINYAYENSKYKTTAEFLNYMPTVVSSKEGTVSFNVLSTSSTESQKANYNNMVGRYITYVVGAKLTGDETSGIKGYTMPTGNISFDASFIQSGTGIPVFEESWGRLYGLYKVDDIDPIAVNIPYSTTHSNNQKKQINNPGEVTITSKGNNIYGVNISNFNSLYSNATIGADDNQLNSNDNYISSVALTVFSPRTVEDGKEDINVTLNTTNGTFTNVNGVNNNISDTSTSNINKYYESNDYSLVSAFYDQTSSSKLSTDSNLNGSGALSKGSTFVYKIDLNYKKTLSNQGLKEVVKIDNNAFRFLPFDDKDYEIELKCGNEKCNNISKDDFEVKFVSGSFDSSNYTLRDVNSLKLSNEDKEILSYQCNNIDLASLNVNEVQNLYGGPCIIANDGVEKTFDKISSAKDENGNEIPITKAIVQTKEGVVLPDNVVVSLKFNLRVRNVSDITQTYQATVVASTSDYDNNLYYYGPSVTQDENSVGSAINYIKTVYSGSNIVTRDTSLFGDSLRIVNFTSRQEITVENKNSDGTMKTNYNVIDNDTITYKVKTIIEDNNEVVGADDTWYINKLVVNVAIPKELEYIPDSDLIQPVRVDGAGNTLILVYELPYTKPNMTIKDIKFRAKIKPTLSTNAAGVPITVNSSAFAQNINGETDNSIFSLLSAKLTINATGINSVIVSQEVGKNGTVVEKNEQISYVLKAYNNTTEDISNYNIVDILPFTGDENGSNVSGTYDVKVNMPDSLSKAKVYCSTMKSTSIKKEIYNENNKWEECNVTEDFVSNVTAIRIENISIPKASYMGDITITLKPNGNKYSDVYSNNFIGQDKTHIQTTSNTIKVKVVSRKISGKVFIDVSGNGVKDGKELYLKGIPVTLYSVGSNNTVTKVLETVTNEDGYYQFKDLDKGRYKVRLNYDTNLYDLTLRYATEDTDKDSDAYKINDKGEAEISNKRTPDDPNGIRLTKDIPTATNMDMGLLSKQSFGFSMKKYITKIDLTYNGSLNTTNYNNESSVSITVRNSLNATAKVYYGIAITNNSTRAGYVNLVEEDIPKGMIFDNTYPENKDWFEVNGVLQSTALSEELIYPGETKYLQISLFMPKREEAGTFLNTASVIQSTIYNPDDLANDNEYHNNDKFVVGDEITYAGVDWHVIGVSNKEDSQDITLLADSGTITNKIGHTTSAGSTYKWSESIINSFINGGWPTVNTLNLPILYDQIVCDDASGLPNGSYGGTIGGNCQSAMYTNTKVRLLTLDEYTYLTTTAGLSDLSWLYGNDDFWLQNTDYISPEYLQTYINAYNNSFSNKEHTESYDAVSYGIQQNTVYNNAMYIGRSNGQYINLTDTANKAKEVRPVITISTNNIVAE